MNIPDIRNFNDLNHRECFVSDLGFVHDLSKFNMKEYVDRHWGGWKEELFWSRINEDNITIIEYRGKAIAFFDIEIEDDVLRISNIQVVKDFQGQGIGSYMIHLVEKAAKDSRAEKIELKVFMDNPAVHFYEKNRFVITDKEDDCFVMEKNMRNG